jgi:anti-sigma factor RsiW
MTRHEDLQRSLGSYVFGSLDPAERTELESHLATCALCRQELASLAGLPGLLGRLSLQEATGTDLLPPPSLLPRVLAAVESERGSRRQRLRRWQAATAATAAMAVAAAAAGVLVLAPSPNGPASRPLVAAAGVPATGEVSLDRRPWGTALQLRLKDLPPASSYTAWAVADGGARVAVASWGPTPDGAAEISGATALGPGDVRSLVVAASDGRQLLSLSL